MAHLDDTFKVLFTENQDCDWTLTDFVCACNNRAADKGRRNNKSKITDLLLPVLNVSIRQN
jgi:hypothetical protein